MSANIGKCHSITSMDEGKDEVDFVVQCKNKNSSVDQKLITNKNSTTSTIPSTNTTIPSMLSTTLSSDKHQCNLLAKKLIPGTLYGDCEVKTSIKSSLSTLEKLAIFNIHRKRTQSPSLSSLKLKTGLATSLATTTIGSTSTTTTNTTTATTTTNGTQKHPKEKHKFVKSSSIARLLGNTYNTKKFENDIKNNNKNNNNGASSNLNNNNNNNSNGDFGGSGSCIGTNNNNNNNSNNPNASRRFGNNERFLQKNSNMDDNINNNDKDSSNITSSGSCCLQDFRDDDKDFSAKAFRTISRSLGKLWWKRTHSVEISTPDPEHKVSYLGNVLTGWAKGEGCIEKPLNTLWRNYTQNHKPDVIMRIRVCASGLKATTRQHGLTEYWAHRITYCCSPKNYPKVFCWIYRHEGRKLKHELRCHAVLCSKESVAQDICNTLRENLDRALRDFKREKLSKQNARLSLANAVYENPSLPRRKILLSVGGNNYRPPLERSKSAPKLVAIEEAIGEEDGECEQTNEPEMKSCCVKDSMYPAMTLGRRRCRRGHSIRRTGKGFMLRSSLRKECNHHNHQQESSSTTSNCCETDESNKNQYETKETKEIIKTTLVEDNEDTKTMCTKTNSISSLGSDDDDLDKLLSYHNYDTNSPLADELLSYFDMKLLNKKTKLIQSSNSLTNLNDEGMNNDNNNNNNENNDFEFEMTLTTDPKPRPTALSLDNLDCFSEENDDSADDDDDDDIIFNENDEIYYNQVGILDLIQNLPIGNLCILKNDDSDEIQHESKHHHQNNDNNDIDHKSDNKCFKAFEMHHNNSVSSNIHNDQQIQQNHNDHHQQNHHSHHHHHHHLDSDEGSISSGCETASTMTANMDDSSLKYNNNHNNNNNESISDCNGNNGNNNENNIKNNNNNEKRILECINNNNYNNDENEESKLIENYSNQRQVNLENNENHNDSNDIKISKTTIKFILPKDKNNKMHQRINNNNEKYMMNGKTIKNELVEAAGEILIKDDASDSEFSDESGYVEFQEQNTNSILDNRKKSVSVL